MGRRLEPGPAGDNISICQCYPALRYLLHNQHPCLVESYLFQSSSIVPKFCASPRRERPLAGCRMNLNHVDREYLTGRSADQMSAGCALGPFLALPALLGSSTPCRVLTSVLALRGLPATEIRRNGDQNISGGTGNWPKAKTQSLAES